MRSAAAGWISACATQARRWRSSSRSGGRPDPQAQGLAQLDAYLAGLGQGSGWLVIFDRRPGLAPLEERVAASVETSPGGRRVTVIQA